MRTRMNALWAILALLSLLAPANAATFTVTTTRDYDPGSFRWAVEQANEISGPDTILFAIPTTDPGYDPELGVWTIVSDTRQSPDFYHIVDDGLFVDGESQRRFIGGDPNPLGPEIEIECRTITFCFIINSSDNVIRGLCFHHADGGIYISSWPPEEVSENNVVAGCYINVDPTGSHTEGGGGEGIALNNVCDARIGGDAPEDRNIIAAGTHENLTSSYCADVEIINNHIGVDRSGTVELGADLGTLVISHATGAHIVRDNIIAGHWLDLVTITHTDTDSGIVTFMGNRVGVGLDGSPMGGHHNTVYLSDAPRHLIRENIIAYAEVFDGIGLYGDVTDYVTVSRNSIYGNNGHGISLANYPCSFQGHDYADGVYGPGVNEEIDPCLCDSAVTSSEGDGGTTSVYLTCMRDCTVEVFIGDEIGGHPSCSEPGYGRVYSGVTYLGDAEEIVQGSVFSTYRFGISPALPPETVITATATNVNGSTSEFGCSCTVPLAGESAEGCVPEEYAFEASAPNHGRDGIELRYRIPEPTRVRIRVYDVAGHQLAVVADGLEQAGEHTLLWMPRGEKGPTLPSGTYLVRLTTERFVATRELVLVR
jgi:hypothetical protein